MTFGLLWRCLTVDAKSPLNQHRFNEMMNTYAHAQGGFIAPPIGKWICDCDRVELRDWHAVNSFAPPDGTDRPAIPFSRHCIFASLRSAHYIIYKLVHYAMDEYFMRRWQTVAMALIHSTVIGLRCERVCVCAPCVYIHAAIVIDTWCGLYVWHLLLRCNFSQFG